LRQPIRDKKQLDVFLLQPPHEEYVSVYYILDWDLVQISGSILVNWKGKL